MDKFLFDNPTYNIVLKGNATGLFGLDEGKRKLNVFHLLKNSLKQLLTVIFSNFKIRTFEFNSKTYILTITYVLKIKSIRFYQRM